MDISTHAEGVKKAVYGYSNLKPCPICHIPYWPGGIHPFGGQHGITKDLTKWCNGKVKGGIGAHKSLERNQPKIANCFGQTDDPKISCSTCRSRIFRPKSTDHICIKIDSSYVDTVMNYSGAERVVCECWIKK